MRAALAAVVLSSGLAAASCAPAPVQDTTEETMAERYRDAIETWRAERAENLTAADGWLTVVELGWLSEGENRAGSGPDAAVVLPPDAAPPFVGTFHRRGMEVEFVPAISGVVQIASENGAGEDAAGELEPSEDRPLRPGRPVAMVPDLTGDPTVLGLDGVSFFVIERGDRLGVRVKDPDSPGRRGFTGIDHYPIALDWRVEARLELHDPPRTVRVPDVLGMVTEQPSPGTAVFEVDGETYRLDAMAGGDGQLFFVFGDRTNGGDGGSYGGGRFLYADLPAEGEPLVLDFNRAVNPPCAFTAFATCPLPPRQNQLDLVVTAGEKAYHLRADEGAHG